MKENLISLCVFLIFSSFWASLGHADTTKAICAKVTALKNPGPLKTKAGVKTRFLNIHNKIRALYGVSQLKWDENLARHAQAWADELKTKHNCNLYHRQNLGRTEGKILGENLALYATSQAKSTFVSSPEFATIKWAGECKDYSYSSNQCAKNKVCGHFTQVVWAKSTKLGCGVAVCGPSGRMARTEVWVCNYDPPGNMTINGKKQKPF